MGEIIGCWIFYAICALIFKHKGGLIALIVLFFLDLIPIIAVVQSFSMLISIAICFCLVYFIKIFQIRNKTDKVNKK